MKEEGSDRRVDGGNTVHESGTRSLIKGNPEPESTIANTNGKGLHSMSYHHMWSFHCDAVGRTSDRTATPNNTT